MPFIGTQPDVGGYSVLDNLTASATASYTLQKDSANFVPSSANQLLVSLNGVIQKPGTSFTVSGSTLTFSSALTSSDSIDFILAMGEPLLVGTPSDGTVTNAKIASGVSASKITTGTLPAAQVPAGSVVQTIGNSLATAITTSGTTFVDTGLTATITPTKTTSKVFIMVDLGLVSTGTADGVRFRLLRDSTEIGSSTGADTHNLFMQFWPNATNVYLGASNHFLDTPSTTSSIVYKLQWASTGTTDTAYINRRASGNYARTTSNFTIMEIGG